MQNDPVTVGPGLRTGKPGDHTDGAARPFIAFAGDSAVGVGGFSVDVDERCIEIDVDAGVVAVILDASDGAVADATGTNRKLGGRTTSAAGALS